MIEFFKYSAALGMDHAGMFGSDKATQSTTTWCNWLKFEDNRYNTLGKQASPGCIGCLHKYAAPGMLYAVQNNVNIHAVAFLGPPLFALFNNSKIAYAAVANRILLNQLLTT